MFQIHTSGQKIATSIGNITILKDIAAGGEGQGYLAEHKGNRVFYKKFNNNAVPPRSPEETLALRKARTKVLVNSRISDLDPMGRINAPIAWSDEGGYVCDWIENLLPLVADPADGPSFLGSARPYAQRVGVLAQIVDLLFLAHSAAISHGDLNDSNIGVVVEGNTVKVYLIDWSNFNNGDARLPPVMAGAEGSMAWWVRSQGQLPDMKSDTYSMAMYGHELLLGRPVVQGCASMAEMLARLEKGDLAGDPLRGKQLIGNTDGLPFEILSAELQSAFRMMLRPDKALTPSMDSFRKTLRESLPNLVSCPTCSSPLWWHSSRRTCPKCHQAVGAALHLSVSGGQTFAISGVTLLGRADLGGDSAISAQHLRVLPTSPGCGQLKVLGLNGVKRQRGAARVHAPAGSHMDLLIGDRLELVKSNGSALVLTVA